MRKEQEPGSILEGQEGLPKKFKREKELSRVVTLLGPAFVMLAVIACGKGEADEPTQTPTATEFRPPATPSETSIPPRPDQIIHLSEIQPPADIASGKDRILWLQNQIVVINAEGNVIGGDSWEIRNSDYSIPEHNAFKVTVDIGDNGTEQTFEVKQQEILGELAQIIPAPVPWTTGTREFDIDCLITWEAVRNGVEFPVPEDMHRHMCPKASVVADGR